MTLEGALPRRFVKHVVRRAASASLEQAPPIVPMSAPNLSRRGSLIATDNGSSLQPLHVIITVGGLIALFLLVVTIGGVCKLANRPRSEARHHPQSQAMFMPSAAGYGARRGDNASTIDAPATNLLDGASPMGMGGNSNYGDSSADLSIETPPRSIKTHTRGKSSGVNLPGPPAAFRRGNHAEHPPLDRQISLEGSTAGPSYSSAAPDGSGFRPGQRIDYGQLNDGVPRGPAGAPNGYAPRQTSLRPGKAANSGPPPAVSRTRSGRYAQGSDPVRRSRIDSVGPGTYRKSMFMPEEPLPNELNRVTTNGSSSGGLRRVESIGRGDARRRSHFVGAGPRGQSLYGGALAPIDIRSAREDGWGSGQRSPGLSTPGAASPLDLGPLGPRGPHGPTSPTDPYARAGLDAYPSASMHSGHGGAEAPMIGGIFPGSRINPVEGVGSGGGRRII